MRSIRREKSQPSKFVLDAEIFNELRESLRSRPASLPDIYRTFIASAEEALSRLATQTDDAPMCTLSNLEVSASMVGAIRVAAAAARMKGASGSPATALRALEREVTLFRDELTTRQDLAGLLMTR